MVVTPTKGYCTVPLQLHSYNTHQVIYHAHEWQLCQCTLIHSIYYKPYWETCTSLHNRCTAYRYTSLVDLHTTAQLIEEHSTILTHGHSLQEPFSLHTCIDAQLIDILYWYTCTVPAHHCTPIEVYSTVLPLTWHIFTAHMHSCIAYINPIDRPAQ